MDEPPPYSSNELLSGPELYALGFTFFVFFLLAVVLAVAEITIWKSTEKKAEESIGSAVWYLKQIFEKLRVYITTWLLLDTVTLISLTVIILFILKSLTILELILPMNTLLVWACTVIVLVFGVGIVAKVLPKIFALKYFNQHVKISANFLRYVRSICMPLSTPLLQWDSKLTKSINKPDQLREELITTLERSIKSEEEFEGQQKILQGIVTFSMLKVSEVMRGRAEIAALNVGMNFHELLQKIDSVGYSRLPVFKNLTDQLVGVLYSKDLLPFLDRDVTFEWQKLLRPGFFVHENKRLDSLLKEFQEKRIHIALVLNDQKRVTGIITLEDVIEEIVGDINDEFDEVSTQLR